MSAEILSSRAMQWAAKVSSIADQARGFTLDAAQTVGSRYTSIPSSEGSRSFDFAKALDARTDREKIEGMRRLLVLTARGEDMSLWFAHVVKNVASASLELRKLVYLYIMRYAESQPDLALLSINTIQKALSDQNQLVRAHALRVMTSIRVPSISGIALLAIKRCQADSSFYVRKTAAMALVKSYALDPSLHKQLMDILKVLLNDDDATVLSSALEAYEVLAGDDIDLLHPHYRRVCSLLSQMDEFGMVSALRVLVRYARSCFKSPGASEAIQREEDFYADADADSATPSTGIDADLALLIRSLEPLLYSSSAAVVLAATQAISQLDAVSGLSKVTAPLVAQLRQPAAVQHVVLTNIAVLCLEHANSFNQYAKHFLVQPLDGQSTWELKLEILRLVLDESNAGLILGELEQYAKDESNAALACAAIRTIGSCAQRQPSLIQACVDLLFSHLQASSGLRVAEAVLALRLLIQVNPGAYSDSCKKLLRSLDTVTAPAARACIFWLAAEQATLLPRVVPDVLRIGVKHFAEEHESVRLQITVLAIKLYVLHCQYSHEDDVQEMNEALADADQLDEQVLHAETTLQANGAILADTAEAIEVSMEQDRRPSAQALLGTDSRVPQLYAHVMHLCRYDPSYDLRDRVRTYKVLASSPSWVLTQRLLFAAKPMPQTASPSEARSKFLLGSSSMLTGQTLKGYQDLADWATTVRGAKERNVIIQPPAARQLSQRTAAGATISVSSSRSSSPAFDKSNGAAVTKPKSKLTGISSLDDFYATSSESSGETEAGEEVSEEEKEETSSGEYETDSEEETGSEQEAR